MRTATLLPRPQTADVVPPPPAEASTKVSVEGKFLSVNGSRFWIRGVTYGSFKQNEQGEPFPPFPQLKDDFARMAEAGINTVRLYTAPSVRIADAAAEAGLMLIPEVGWAPRFCELDTPREQYLFSWAEEKARELAGHPAILMYSIGNEMPPLMVRWYGIDRVSRFLRRMGELVKEHTDGALVTYVNHPPTEYLNLPQFDVVSYNIYLEDETAFRGYLARLHSLAGDRPVFLAELGLDSGKHGRLAQSDFLWRYLRAAFEKGLCGAAVYSWTDQWEIFDESIHGWSFGITDAERNPKPALEAVEDIYGRAHYQMRPRDWPVVSVVVATYNGSRTLAPCLRSLLKLNYPNYEVLVIDDGSTDAVPEVATSFPVRYHRVESNGGLSNARNEGIRLSRGEIVAFIDDDAYADPDWLFFMVQALIEQDASAVGGPNLPPPDDEFVAQCVDEAPGNPTHVLLGDELAEHVPGCNMAYRKEDLEKIGLFDVTHRAAGDDVDVCWKLLVRQKTIAFSPSAIVWHRRRATVRAYLKQQRGYGYAEAHLHEVYPSRFNVLGHSVWKGHIYDTLNSWSFTRIPALLKPRIYQGVFGSAMFQTMYQPRFSSWLQLFKTIEWQVLSLSLIASGLLSAFFAWGLPVLLVVPGLLAACATVTACAVAGTEAALARTAGWSRRQQFLGALLVAGLHLGQPWARVGGRLRGWFSLRGGRRLYPRIERMWGNMSQRTDWLQLLSRHLAGCGWICRSNDDWESVDLVVTGPGTHEVRLTSVYEEVLHKGFHWVRFRVESRRKASFYVALLALLPALGLILAWPTLLPLALPLGGVFYSILKSRQHMENAVAQAALECGEALDMPAVDAEYTEPC